MRRTVVLLMMFVAFGAMAHPGGLDANGGHTDRKTGIYHYHRKTNAPAGNLAAESRSTPTVSDSRAASVQDPSSNSASPSVDVETKVAEMETEPVDFQKVDVATGAASAQRYLPWWVYLIGLGCGYVIWELGSYYYQKTNGKQ